jgi:hypothetical protein
MTRAFLLHKKPRDPHYFFSLEKILSFNLADNGKSKKKKYSFGVFDISKLSIKWNLQTNTPPPPPTTSKKCNRLL